MKSTLNKKNDKDNNNKITLKGLLTDANDLMNEKKYEEAYDVYQKVSIKYPKNYHGWHGLILSKTKEFTNYCKKEDIKLLKEYHEKELKVTKKGDLEKTELMFNEYLSDCNAVRSLNQLRDKITLGYFKQMILEEKIKRIKQKQLILDSSVSKNKMMGVSNLIIGLFFIGCLIYSLFSPSILLLITIIFGIFGFVTVYRFFETNFFKRGKVRSKEKGFIDVLNSSNLCIIKTEELIKKTEEEIQFLINQKASAISSIPTTFIKNIECLLNDNEKNVANELFNLALKKQFEEPLIFKEYKDYENFFIENLEKDEDALTTYIDKISKERKSNFIEYSNMKEITNFDNIRIVLCIVISILMSIFLYFSKNAIVHTLNVKPFIYGYVCGLIVPFLYNIKEGRHEKVFNTFIDNFVCTIFGTMLVYLLVTNNMNKSLNFLKDVLYPMFVYIITLLWIILLVSTIKYKALIKKLRS